MQLQYRTALSLPLARLSSKKNFEKTLLLVWGEESAIISVKNYGLILSVFVKYAPEINEKKTGQKMIHEIAIWIYSLGRCTTS